MKYLVTPIVCGAYQENAFLLCPAGRPDALLIDPGDDLPALRQALRQSGRTLAGICLTHGHFDHMLSAKPLADQTGAPVYVHALDKDMLTNPRLNVFDASVSRQPSPKTLEAELLSGSFVCAGLEFAVLHTPGHTPGSVCLYDAENANLFSGDTLFCTGFGRMDLPGGSPEQMRASLGRLFHLPGETRVFCGHGAQTTIASERERYR